MASEQIKQWESPQATLDDLTLKSVDKPSPKDGEVLVKINTVALNYRDTEGRL